MSGSESATGRRWGRLARFLRDEAGAATAEWVVMTGLCAAICALVVFSISSGTSTAATSIASDIERSADVAIASAGNHRERASYGSGRTTHYRPSGYDERDGASAGGGNASAGGGGGSAAAGGGGASTGGGSTTTADSQPAAPSESSAPAPAGDATAEGTAIAGAVTPATSETSGGTRPGNANRPGAADTAPDAPCGLGQGNASATGNAQANGRAHQTPASNCVDSPRA